MNFLKKYLYLGLLVPVVFLALALGWVKLADNYFSHDNFSQAGFLYDLGAKLFPIGFNFQSRKLALDITQTERREHSEETDFDELTPGRQSNVLGTTTQVPVLMYHYIRVNPKASDKVGYNLSVTPENFAAQMDYLATHGYHTISLDDLGGALFSKGSLPSKPIAITFDDGYADCYWAAFPVLKSHGFQALAFVITGVVDSPNYLTWSQIDEMKNSGTFKFGSHTVHHYALTYLSSARVKAEVTDSKNVLQQHLGYNINWTAYPYGNVDGRVAGITKQAGYAGAFGTNNGTYQSTDYLFTLPRVRVSGGDTISSFATKLPWK